MQVTRTVIQLGIHLHKSLSSIHDWHMCNLAQERYKRSNACCINHMGGRVAECVSALGNKESM